MATDEKGARVLAVGRAASEMVGRGRKARAVRLVRDGNGVDYNLAGAMLQHLIGRIVGRQRIFRPDVMLSVAAMVTGVERRAVLAATIQAGAKTAYLIDKPMAAAIGARVSVATTDGIAIVNLGAGSTELAVIGQGETLASESLRIGGDAFDRAIEAAIVKTRGVRLMPGEAERLKIQLGSASGAVPDADLEVSAVDEGGARSTLRVSGNDVRAAIQDLLEAIATGLQRVVAQLPEARRAAVLRSGAVLTGGGAQLHGIAEFLALRAGVPTRVAPEPQSCEALLAQPALRACDGATVFASADAVGTLLGLSSVGRAIVVDDSPRELLRVFRRLRVGSVDTVVVPFPARLLHVALAYFAGVPRRLIAAGGNRWAATERVPGIKGMHPVEGNWRLGAVASNRPVLTPGEAPALQLPEAVRSQAMARWPAFIGSGRRPLVLIPGGGGWSSRRSNGLWPAERFAVVANQSAADRIVLLSGAGDERIVRETLGGIAKPTLVINLAQITVDEVAVVSEISRGVVGHDGDALHVAAAARAPVLAVVGRPDIPPRGDRVVTLWTDDFERFPARQVVEALSKQARIDSYA